MSQSVSLILKSSSVMIENLDIDLPLEVTFSAMLANKSNPAIKELESKNLHLLIYCWPRSMF